MVDVLLQFIDISHVPLIMQRRCTGEVPQIQFSPATVDIPVVQQRRGIFSRADDGGEDASCVIFRAPPVVPELSASFSSFRALTAVSARGLHGVPESPGV